MYIKHLQIKIFNINICLEICGFQNDYLISKLKSFYSKCCIIIKLMKVVHVQSHVIYRHRYLREVDCSEHISSQKIHCNKTRALVWAQNRQAGKIMQEGWQGRQPKWINVPAITANIFVAATNRTNIHNKTESAHN